MTFWLSNLAAYSVQLAVLVGTAAVLVSILGIHLPRAALRFWQAVFASSLLWPIYQVWANVDAPTIASAARFGPLFSGAGSWAGAGNLAAPLVGIAAIDTGTTRMLIAVLATGAAIRLGCIGLGLIKLRSIRVASEPAHVLASVAVPLQHELGVTADIRFSDAVDGPATLGVRTPVVLLPYQVRDLPAAVQRAVLCHELIHVRRRDWLAALMEEVWCAVLWFHPAARALAARLTLARETVVDAATIAHTRERRAYAAALLAFATVRPPFMAATSLFGGRHAERRISLIAQEASMSRSSLAIRLALAAALVTAATLTTTSKLPIIATVQAQSQAQKIYRGDDAGVTLPRAVKEVKPTYTAAAMQARIQGTVWLTVVVLANGDVGDVSVATSLDKEHGLDEQAVNATREWKFAPGRKDGKPVPVEVTIEIRFTLK